jgi:exosome complex exonuclease DIS3/RRP44
MLSSILATLKNDDAEDSDEEGDDLLVHEHESKVFRAERTKKPPTEKQPTGRVVGVIKRNWRAYVSSLILPWSID